MQEIRPSMNPTPITSEYLREIKVDILLGLIYEVPAIERDLIVDELRVRFEEIYDQTNTTQGEEFILEYDEL